MEEWSTGVLKSFEIDRVSARMVCYADGTLIGDSLWLTDVEDAP